MKAKVFIISVSIIIFAKFVYAKGVGTTMFQILQMPTNAYDASLANTTSACENSVISNPSLIPFVDSSIILSHAVYMQDMRYSVGDINIPINEFAGLNFSFCFLNIGTMDKVIEYNNSYIENGSFSANNKVFNISYGTMLGNSFSAGISIKYISETIDDTSYSGFAANLSGLYFLSQTTYFNIGLNNLGPSVKGYSLPTNIYCSLTGYLNKTTVGIIQVDDYYNDEIIEIKIATEKIFNDIFLVRLGYIIPDKNYSGSNNIFLTNLTLGAGLKFKDFFVDYAWLPKGDFGNINMFTIRLNF